MHHALRIADIQYLIFEHLEPHDLARLARTCRTLFDVAIRELWRTVTSASAFVCPLPSDHRLRPLRQEDIRRLDFYTSMVENVYLDSQDIKKVIRLPAEYRPIQSKKHPVNRQLKPWRELWQEIAELRPHPQFLPNLRRLRMSNVVEELFAPFLGISGKNLVQVYIKWVQYRTKEALPKRMLEQFQETPNLTYLFVKDGKPDDIILKIIRQSPLETLRLDQGTLSLPCPDLPQEIFLKPTLKHLNIALGEDWYDPQRWALDKTYLPNLQTLRLNLSRFAYLHHNPRQPISSFLNGFDNPRLSLLSLRFAYTVTSELFLETVSAVKKSCRLDDLEDLRLGGTPHCPALRTAEFARIPEPKVKPEMLREAMLMLLPMPSLKKLCITVAPDFLDVLDEHLYKSIANGLPSLKSIWLGSSCFVMNSHAQDVAYEKTSLHHLAAFTSMLPNLKYVRIGVADMTCTGLEPTTRSEWACPGVKTLDIRYWYNRGGVPYEHFDRTIQTYFPNSDLAQKARNLGWDRRNELYYDFRCKHWSMPQRWLQLESIKGGSLGITQSSHLCKTGGHA